MPKIWNAHSECVWVCVYECTTTEMQCDMNWERDTSGEKQPKPKKCIVLVTYFAKLPNLF